MTRLILPVLLIVIMASFVSCQKEVDGTIISGGQGSGGSTPTARKPGLGTVWTYRYYSYYPSGQILTSGNLVLKAASEVSQGGETWLNIVDTSTQTTVYLLKKKVDGLYQYTNNNSYLFLKDPAVVNDSYMTYHDGADELFTVRRVKDTMPVLLGNIPLNYYEGKRGPEIIHDIWYNENYWIVQQFTYFRNLSNVYYRRYAMYLAQIKY
jgi:hypothetical protein